MKRIFLLVFFVFLSLGQSFAFDYAGLQPVAPFGVFSAFSTESIGRKQVAIETGFERSREPDFYRVSLRGAYGLTDSMELEVNVPYMMHFEGTMDGIEDIAFGFKHRFYDEGKYGPSLAYMVTASTDSGRKEFSTQGRVGGGFLMSKRVGPFNGHFNIFYAHPGTNRLHDELSFLGGIEFAAAHNFKLLAEVMARKSHFSSEYDRIEARFGYRLLTTDNIYTTLGAAVDLKARSPELRLMASVSFLTSPQKKEIKKIFEKED